MKAVSVSMKSGLRDRNNEPSFRFSCDSAQVSQ